MTVVHEAQFKKLYGKVMFRSPSIFYISTIPFPAGNYMFKVNNRNTRTRCVICSKLTIKTSERRTTGCKTSEQPAGLTTKVATCRCVCVHELYYILYIFES